MVVFLPVASQFNQIEQIMMAIVNATEAMELVFKTEVILTPSTEYKDGFLFEITIKKDKEESFVVFASIASRDEAVEHRIRDSVELFTPSFLQTHLRVHLPVEAIIALQALSTANQIFYDLLEDFDEFVKDAVMEDGRGHFLAHADFEERNFVYNDVIFWYYRED